MNVQIEDWRGRKQSFYLPMTFEEEDRLMGRIQESQTQLYIVNLIARFVGIARNR